MKVMKKLIASLALTVFFAAPAMAELKPGTVAPQFVAPAFLAGNGTAVDLKAELKKGPVVLYFFPAAFTAGCNIEAHMFSQAIKDFRAAGATVIGMTAGNIDRLAEFSKSAEHCAGNFTVASDPGAKIAAKYDALLALKPGWSSRTSYVIGRDGRIVYSYSDLSPKEHITRTLAAVRAIGVAPKKP